MHLHKSLQAWPGETFKDALKAEIEALDKALLPLQQGLSQGSYVGPSAFSVMLLGSSEETGRIQARAGVFYTGIIAGCNCADDPSPVDELTEYCEVSITIDKKTARALIELSAE